MKEFHVYAMVGDGQNGWQTAEEPHETIQAWCLQAAVNAVMNRHLGGGLMEYVPGGSTASVCGPLRRGGVKIVQVPDAP